MRGRLRDIPLEEFYDLLFKSTGFWSGQKKNLIPTKVEHPEMKAKQEGLKICSFILEVFGLSLMSVATKLFKYVNNELLNSVNFCELLRTFLAIKILFDSIDEVDDDDDVQNAIPRMSIYQSYSMICNRLTKDYTAVPNFSKFHNRIVVGVSQLGRIIKLV